MHCSIKLVPSYDQTTMQQYRRKKLDGIYCSLSNEFTVSHEIIYIFVKKNVGDAQQACFGHNGSIVESPSITVL